MRIVYEAPQLELTLELPPPPPPAPEPECKEPYTPEVDCAVDFYV